MKASENEKIAVHASLRIQEIDPAIDVHLEKVSRGNDVWHIRVTLKACDIVIDIIVEYFDQIGGPDAFADVEGTEKGAQARVDWILDQVRERLGCG